MIKEPANIAGEGTSDIEECILLKGLWKHTNVLEVNKQNMASCNFDEKIIFGDVGVINRDHLAK